MILIAELINHFVNGNVNMAKIMKRAQTGKNVPKGMVESEMSPGKMIPKSKSNYATGNYAKMLGSKPKAKVAPKKAQNGKATTDSTTYYTKKLKYDADKEDYTTKYGFPNPAYDRARKETDSTLGSLARQLKKGKPGYDPNGFPKQKSGGKMTKKPMKAGGMLKRADGSYSKRGLWDNIRANKGSGKKPTAAMLKQERKIKAKSKK